MCKIKWFNFNQTSIFYSAKKLSIFYKSFFFKKHDVIQYKKIKEFMEKYGKEPKLNSNDPIERRMAEAIVYLKNKQRQKN